MQINRLDCVVVGYNEPPFERYETLVRGYGDDSEAYRDLKFSFVDLDGRKLTHVDLLNEVFTRAGAGASSEIWQPFRSGDIPNLAAAYLTSYLRRRGFSAEYVNLFQDQKSQLDELLDRDPLCIAITTTLYVINFPVSEMVEYIRARNRRVKVIVGGPLIANHVRNYVDGALDAALADLGADLYIVEGQGEETLARVVSCLRDGRGLSTVPNLIVPEGGRHHRTDTLAENNSLEENFVDWAALSDGDLGPTLQTRTARSCAFSCSFCNYPTRAGRLSLASLDTIERELDSMARRGNVRNLIFIDDTFNVPLPRFKDICRLMIRKDYGFSWFSYFRCSNSDDEAVDLMAQSGCKGVFLGIESGSPTILTHMSKAATIEKYERGIGLLKAREILTFGSFIVGFPGETEETIEETFDFIRDTGLDYYRTQLWYNEPGTPIQGDREKFKIAGDGFVWNHATMTSMEAMDHIERMYLSLDGPLWLAQWSFDFWIIPYLLGRGLSLESFRELMAKTHKLQALEIVTIPAQERLALQSRLVDEMVDLARSLRTSTSGRGA